MEMLSGRYGALREVLRISRFAFVGINESIQSATLHGFSDSSKSCYAAVLYLQIVISTCIKVQFLTAKTKVAPLKEMSIARLELLGCTLLSELIKQVFEGFQERIPIDRVRCWCDSKVALCWLKGKTKRWKPWVENRVVKVRKVVDCENWFFIPGEENPADIPTRVCEKRDFVRWFRGPEFLYHNNFKEDCFDVEAKLNDAEVLVESRNIESSTLFVATEETTNKHSTDISTVINCTRFGTFNKLINTTAYVLRFVKNLKAKCMIEGLKGEYVTTKEREHAVELWIKAEQNNILKHDPKGKLINSLKLYVDNDGITRLKGRFGSSSIEYNVKHPILIGNGERHLSKLIIPDAHERVMHGGVESTLNLIRNKFWMLKGRQSVKNILRSCVICKRFQGRPCVAPNSPDLPEY